MKKSVLTGIALLALAPLAVIGYPAAARADAPPPHRQAAPQGQGGKHGPGDRLEMMAKALSLTDAQKSHITAIIKENSAKVNGIRGNTTLTNDQKNQKIMAYRKDMFNQINAILTPGQREKLKDLMKRPR